MKKRNRSSVFHEIYYHSYNRPSLTSLSNAAKSKYMMIILNDLLLNAYVISSNL